MDLDGDGLEDILSGSWPGDIHFFRRTSKDEFACGKVLEGGDGKKLHVGRATTVHAADWDRDGRVDLIVGNITGEVFFIRNTGSRTEPSFGPSRRLEGGGRPIRTDGGDAGPCVADWNGDGRLDLLVGSGSGSVVWYRNVGDASGEPLLEESVPLLPATDNLPEDGRTRASRGIRSKICVVDFNGDGRDDLLVGDLQSFRVATPQREDRAAQPDDTGAESDGTLVEENVAEKKTWLEELLSEYRRLNRKPRHNREALAELDRRILRLIGEIERSEALQKWVYTGTVWFFARKEPASTP